MRVVILDDYQDAISRLACFSKLKDHDVRVFSDTIKDVPSLAARLIDADAVVLIRERTRITDMLLARLPKLRLISQTGKNAPHIDLAACTRRGIVVSAGGGSGQATAELTWGLILSALRHIPTEVAALRAGRWQTTIGDGVLGKTLGIYGYGKIGKQVAQVGRAFGMNVQVWGREGSRSRATQDGLTIAANEEALFTAADILSVHLTLNEGTRGIIKRAHFDRMKPTALFVNTSRAGIVESGALENALRAGRPGAAAVDVYEDEPVMGGNHPLLKMDNVVCTPHLGYVERNGYESFFATAFDQINAFAGGAPINVLNPEVLARGA